MSYEEHIEELESLLKSEDAQIYDLERAAIRAALELMHAAEPKDEAEELAHCVRRASEILQRDEVGRVQGLLDERAAARAEGRACPVYTAVAIVIEASKL